MPNILTITVDEPDDLLNAGAYGSGAVVRVQTSATQGGVYADVSGTGSTPTVALVTATTEYTGYDPNGTVDSWYRTRYENSGATRTSDYTVPFQATSSETTGSTAPGPTGHCYATLAQLKNYLVSVAADYGTGEDDRLLRALLSSSRKIDNHASRTGPGYTVAGFGPRVGTNRYNAPRGRRLDLRDDLLALTSITVVPSLGSSATTYTDETDFYKGPFDRAPYREFELHGAGQSTWYSVQRGISITGKWGHGDTHEALTTLAAAITTTTATTAYLVAEPSPGHTLLIDSEQMFVRAVDAHATSGWDATVVRGANGTTAATHLIAAQTDVYTYPPEVTECCLVLAQRALKSRDAGLTGDFGGLTGVPMVMHRDSERAVLREYLWPYSIVRI